MPKQRKAAINLFKWVPVVSIAGSIGVGGVIWTAWIARNVAQTSYVDELLVKQVKYVDSRIAEVVKYTDDKTFSVKKEAFDHSDLNKGIMESEYKGLSAKLDMLIMMVQQSSIRK